MDRSEFDDWLATVRPTETPFRNGDKPLHLDRLFSGACFIVCGGPSLNTLDLSLLNRRGIFSLGINNAAAHFRTSAMVCVDPPEKFHSALWGDPGMLKFVGLGRLKRGKIRIKRADGKFAYLEHDGRAVLAKEMPGVIGYSRHAHFEPDTFLTDNDICWGVDKVWARKTGRARCLNSMFAALRIAYSLGFRTVLLLGCDFKMSADQPYAFGQGGDDEKARTNNDGYNVMVRMFNELRPRFDAAGFRVLNCNPESGLTSFDYLSYGEAIEFATAQIPQGRLDLSGWYEKGVG